MIFTILISPSKCVKRCLMAGLCAQVRVLLYMGALCSGILDALTDVESKAVAALACPGKDRWFLGALTRRIHRRKHLHRHNTALRRANIHKGKVKRSLNDMLTRTSVRSGEGAHPVLLWKPCLFVCAPAAMKAPSSAPGWHGIYTSRNSNKCLPTISGSPTLE